MSVAEEFNHESDNQQSDTVRSRMKLIKGLLRRAVNGESRYTVPEMKAEIAARLERARDMPEGHKAIMRIIHKVEADMRENRETLRAIGMSDEEIGPDSRALRNLSIREQMNGRDVTYMDRADLQVCQDALAVVMQRPSKLALS